MKADDLFEMSNIRKSFSGLPVNIYISSGGSTNHRHGPRIKVMTNTGDRFNPYETISIILKRDISEDDIIGYHKLPSDILESIREYINLNFDVLIAHWNDELASDEVIPLLKSIKKL